MVRAFVIAETALVIVISSVLSGLLAADSSQTAPCNRGGFLGHSSTRSWLETASG
jgi:hypothetical protein